MREPNRKRAVIHGLALCALAGCAAPLNAQDSVSRNSDAGNGLPGDALSPWNTGAGQRASYVVDLATIHTSTGTAFGMGPILKSGKTSATRFSGLNGASVISPRPKLGAPYPSTSYSFWNLPAGGVNATENSASVTSSIPRTGA